MQDRLKFRIYIKYLKQIFNIDAFWVDNIKEKVTVHFSDGHTKTFKFEDIIIEQCTGLHDKNGKLIYEGDILQDSEQKILVEYDVNRHCFMFEYQDTSAYKPICDIDVLSGNFEVIGNINENADLLGEQR